MLNYEKILELAKENNGIVTTAMIVRKGISRGVLKYISDSGILQRASRGVYIYCLMPGKMNSSISQAGINAVSFLWKRLCIFVI